ncbi:MAG: MerR family transcriptional regulator [Methanomicrobiales archaeon]|nr:MerR family transcriptional regulator [Methanomicrobiales archaeon]
MTEETIKIGDIARMTGLSEKEVRAYVQEYEDLLHYRQLGRIRLYTPAAAETIAAIARLDAEGHDRDAIVQEVGGKKGRKQTTAPRRTAPPQAPPSRDHAPVRHGLPVQGVSPTAMAEMTARYEQQQKRLRARIEAQEAALEKARRDLSEAREMINRLCDTGDGRAAATDAWIEHFDARLSDLEAGQRTSAESLREWIEYIEAELAEIRRPLADRVRERLR